jgi:hypothetical protein
LRFSTQPQQGPTPAAQNLIGQDCKHVLRFDFLMSLIRSKIRQRAQDETKIWDDLGLGSGPKVYLSFDDDDDPYQQAAREKFLSRLTPASRCLLAFVEQWFNVGRRSDEGRLNTSSILYALKDEEAVRDEFLDAVDLVSPGKHPLGGIDLTQKDSANVLDVIKKYVLHTRAAEVRGALKGIEHGWDVVKFAEVFKAARSRTRRVIVKYVHMEMTQRGPKAKLADIDICNHLDGVQLRVWERRARDPETGDIIPQNRERLRYPMPKSWTEVIKTDEDDTGPWIGALRHAELHDRVEKFLSKERSFATSAAANLYWAWSELAGQTANIGDIAADVERNRDPREPNGAYLAGVIRRTATPPNDV